MGTEWTGNMEPLFVGGLVFRLDDTGGFLQRRGGEINLPGRVGIRPFLDDRSRGAFSVYVCGIGIHFILEQMLC